MEKLKYVNRKNTNARKWDNLHERYSSSNLLPFWIADMDFASPKAVRNALKKYIDVGVYGYYYVDNDYYDAFINWEYVNHNRVINKECLRFSPGVVPAINWFIQILTKVGDSVLTMPPIYYPFFEAINKNKRKHITSELIYKNDVWTIDYEDLERKIKNNNVKMILFCSPHNPISRVWTKEEIEKVLVLANKYKVYVISDEIHHDILMNGYKHISVYEFSKYTKNTIILMSASKTFNLAGFKNSIVIIRDTKLRKLYDDFYDSLRIAGGCSVGYIATTIAYLYGKNWLHLVKQQIYNNYMYVREKLSKNFPKIKIATLEGTYLMWIDFSYYMKNKDIKKLMEENIKIAVDYGEWFGSAKYKNCIRVNLATNTKNIKQLVSNVINNKDKIIDTV